MKFGLSTLTRGVFTTPESYSAVAKAAERAGFDFLSVSDHLVVPANLKVALPLRRGRRVLRPPSTGTASTSLPLSRSWPAAPTAYGFSPR